MNKKHYDQICCILCDAGRDDLKHKITTTVGYDKAVKIDDLEKEINLLTNEVSRLHLLISAARKHGEDSESPFYEMMKLLNGEKK